MFKYDDIPIAGLAIHGATFVAPRQVSQTIAGLAFTRLRPSAKQVFVVHPLVSRG